MAKIKKAFIKKPQEEPKVDVINIEPTSELIPVVEENKDPKWVNTPNGWEIK